MKHPQTAAPLAGDAQTDPQAEVFANVIPGLTRREDIGINDDNFHMFPADVQRWFFESETL
jgi:hypothetical protein